MQSPCSPVRDLAILLLFQASVALAPVAAQPQPTFSPNNGFDFRAVHRLANLGGSTFESASIRVDTPVDWRMFKLVYDEKASTPFYLGWDDGLGVWSVNGVFVDWTGTGQQWIPLASGTVLSHEFPPPPNGVSEVHRISVKVVVQRPVVEPPGSGFVQTSFTRDVDLTIFPDPPVFTTPAGDALVQLRNADATGKAPFLIVEGFDPVNATSLDTYYFLSSTLIDALHAEGYEVFFLNFHDATRDLAANADIVRAALRTVHQRCPNSGIALAGMSAGGVIARYALAESEDEVIDDNHYFRSTTTISPASDGQRLLSLPFLEASSR